MASGTAPWFLMSSLKMFAWPWCGNEQTFIATHSSTAQYREVLDVFRRHHEFALRDALSSKQRSNDLRQDLQDAVSIATLGKMDDDCFILIRDCNLHGVLLGVSQGFRWERLHRLVRRATGVLAPAHGTCCPLDGAPSRCPSVLRCMSSQRAGIQDIHGERKVYYHILYTICLSEYALIAHVSRPTGSAFKIALFNGRARHRIKVDITIFTKPG